MDYRDGNKWELQSPNLAKLKELLTTWQLEMQAAGGWNAVFWCNHDQPRAVSRFGDDKRYWKESAKMLATCIHLLRGTPYIFQGEELGITNAGYTAIDQYRDVESLNYYKIMLRSGKTEAEALEILRQRSRDNGRTPMQWSGKRNAGFTSGTPWITPPDNFKTINAEEELLDEDSILHYYMKLIQLRKEQPVVSDGQIEFLCETCADVFAYRRFLDGDALLVFNNLTGKEVALTGISQNDRWKKVIGNYADVLIRENRLVLRPYESIVYQENIASAE